MQRTYVSTNSLHSVKDRHLLSLHRNSSPLPSSRCRFVLEPLGSLKEAHHSKVSECDTNLKALQVGVALVVDIQPNECLPSSHAHKLAIPFLLLRKVDLESEPEYESCMRSLYSYVFPN